MASPMLNGRPCLGVGSPLPRADSPTSGKAISIGASINGAAAYASEFSVQLTSVMSDLIFRRSSNWLGAVTVIWSLGSQARHPSGRKVRNTGPGPSIGNSSKTCVAVSRRPGPTITPRPWIVTPLPSSSRATATTESPASCSDPIGPKPSLAEYSVVCQDRAAYSDEAGHAFQDEAGPLFRFHSGRRSDLKPATSWSGPRSNSMMGRCRVSGQGVAAAVVRGARFRRLSPDNSMR